MDVKRIRKAIVAGGGATVTALVGSLVHGGGAPATTDGWAALVIGAVAAGALVGWTTWRVPNAGAASGSAPALRVRPGRPPL